MKNKPSKRPEWSRSTLPWFLAWFTLQPWRRRRDVPPQIRLNFNGLRDVISSHIIFFICSFLVLSSDLRLGHPSCLFPSNLSSYMQFKSRDSSVGTATGYGLDDRGVGVRVPVGTRIFSSTRRPDWFWGSPNLLSNGYLGILPGGKVAGAWGWPLTSS
jgi:hypothetical protein